MPRPYYAEYVKHAMRYYAKSVLNSGSEKPRFRSDADKKNWLACDSVIKNYPEAERDMLLTIYSDGDTVPDVVYQIARKLKIDQDSIWKLLNDCEKKIAKRRGLL